MFYTPIKNYIRLYFKYHSAWSYFYYYSSLTISKYVSYHESVEIHSCQSTWYCCWPDLKFYYCWLLDSLDYFSSDSIGPICLYLKIWGSYFCCCQLFMMISLVDGFFHVRKESKTRPNHLCFCLKVQTYNFGIYVCFWLFVSQWNKQDKEK